MMIMNMILVVMVRTIFHTQMHINHLLVAVLPKVSDIDEAAKVEVNLVNIMKVNLNATVSPLVLIMFVVVKVSSMKSRNFALKMISVFSVWRKPSTRKMIAC